MRLKDCIGLEKNDMDILCECPDESNQSEMPAVANYRSDTQEKLGGRGGR